MDDMERMCPVCVTSPAVDVSRWYTNTPCGSFYRCYTCGRTFKTFLVETRGVEEENKESD